MHYPVLVFRSVDQTKDFIFASSDLCVMLSNGSAQCLNCSEGYENNLECNRYVQFRTYFLAKLTFVFVSLLLYSLNVY